MTEFHFWTLTFALFLLDMVGTAASIYFYSKFNRQIPEKACVLELKDLAENDPFVENDISLWQIWLLNLRPLLLWLIFLQLIPQLYYLGVAFFVFYFTYNIRFHGLYLAPVLEILTFGQLIKALLPHGLPELLGLNMLGALIILNMDVSKSYLLWLAIFILFVAALIETKVSFYITKNVLRDALKKKGYQVSW